MKKIFTICIIIVVLLCIISSIVFIQYKNIQAQKQEVAKFNLQYEEYNKETLNGLDITTLINKAISNNEKNEISKSENNIYNLDDEKSIEIYVSMNGNTHKMEKIVNLGIDSFIEYFGTVGFKCTEVKYHEKNGRIASMTFEAIGY